MAEVIRMPRLSDTMEEGNIVEWNKNVGDKVSVGDVLAEVETDKATMDLESFFEGTLLYIGVEEGTVPVNAVLAVIGDEGEDYKAALEADEANQSSSDDSTSEETEKDEPQASTSDAKSQSDQSSQPSQSSTTSSSDERIKASPLAKKMAEEKGIDLATVTGSGDNGRIVKRDIEEYKGAPASGSSRMVSMPSQSDFEYGEKPVSQMRKVISKRLSESKFTAPHFYLTMEIDMGKAIEARKALNENAESRISFNDIVVKAVAMALRKHPQVNSSWLGDKIRYNEEINIGVAVAIPDGLLVPVINNTDLKSLSMINREVKELAGLAREKRLQPEQMSGNTFTISNLGMYPIDEFTAIINPPDACIMAIGTIVKKPVVKNDQIVIGNMMKVTLSCDHRVVDGATGSEFLKTFKKMLEEPLSMIL